MEFIGNGAEKLEIPFFAGAKMMRGGCEERRRIERKYGRLA